jgi:hypothetical protein
LGRETAGRCCPLAITYQSSQLKPAGDQRIEIFVRLAGPVFFRLARLALQRARQSDRTSGSSC